jgi:hypothetical protein
MYSTDEQCVWNGVANFDQYYENILTDETHHQKSEFFDKCGKQHYRLLAYLSTLFNDQVIIDIGTHRGSSSLALSYNPTNTIHSFDIVDKKTNDIITKLPNVQFHLHDLFDATSRQSWHSTIMSSAFIFLDVDPHNGTMEYEFCTYLKDNNYKGFVVCDDIWYFKEMRDNFWYKFDYKYRYDYSNLGHWSGTGILAFDDVTPPIISDYFVPKYNNSNWTLVTAYFNLTKCGDASQSITERDDTYYMSHSLSTLNLPYNLVVFCDKESHAQIKHCRPTYLDSKTKYIICEFDNFCLPNEKTTFSEYRQQIIENRKNKPYQFDDRNTASYYLFCVSRYIMLTNVISENPFNSSHFGWINFCIERMGYQNVSRLDEALHIKRNKFSTCYIDYIPESMVTDTAEYFKYGRCSMCSGFFTGNAHYMYLVCNLILRKFKQYVDMGYGHADEQLYSPVYFENPTLFEHYYGDYQQMITNYVYVYDAPEPPIYNFITRSWQHGNYKKCYECCCFVYKSLCLGKCNLNQTYLDKLHHFMTNSFKQLMLCKDLQIVSL